MSKFDRAETPTSPFPAFRRLLGPIIVVMVCALISTGRAQDSKKEESKKEEPKKEEPKKEEAKRDILKGKEAQEVVNLKREVDALEVLYHLEPTEAQLKSLLKLGEHTAAKPKPPAEAVAGPEYRAALRDFRNALVENDEDKVNEANEKLAEVNQKDPPEIEEEFEITEAARKAAPNVLKLLTPAQVISFLVSQESEVPDPVERIMITFHEGEELPEDAWKTHRQETAEEVAWLVHGFDNDQARAAVKPILALLDKGHSLKGEVLKKELPNLEKAARNLVGGKSPTVVLEHYMQRELAELLSNPQTISAIKARIQADKKKAE
jgi:hypothetical protein